MPFRGRARDTAESPPSRGERQQAAVAGQPLLVLARAVADPFPGPVSRSHIRSGVGQLGQVAGAAGHDVVQQQRLVVVGPSRRRWGRLIAAISMWSGLPPICSRRPSSSAAARLGTAKWSPRVTDVRQPDHQRPGSSGCGSGAMVAVCSSAAFRYRHQAGARRAGCAPALGVELAAALAHPEQRGRRAARRAIARRGAVAGGRPRLTQRRSIGAGTCAPKS